MYATKNDLPAKKREALAELLNGHLALCLDVMLQTKQAHWNVKGTNFIALHELFDKINEDFEEYTDLLAERIVQLGGAPDFAPDSLVSRAHSEYVEGVTLVDMIKEDLIAERIAIDSYREMIAYFSSFDSTTRKMLEEITANEEEHADDLADLLQNLPKDMKD